MSLILHDTHIYFLNLQTLAQLKSFAVERSSSVHSADWAKKADWAQRRPYECCLDPQSPAAQHVFLLPVRELDGTDCSSVRGLGLLPHIPPPQNHNLCHRLTHSFSAPPDGWYTFRHDIFITSFFSGYSWPLSVPFRLQCSKSRTLTHRKKYASMLYVTGRSPE